MKVKTVYMLLFSTISVFLSVLGQPVELCEAKQCCENCCRTAEDAQQLPGFVEAGGCKNGCNAGQDCNNINSNEEVNIQSCEVGKDFLFGEVSFDFGGILVCCLSDATLGFDEVACGLQTGDPTVSPTPRPTTAIPTLVTSASPTQLRDLDTESGSQKIVIVGVFGFFSIFVSIGVAVILLLRAKNRLKLLQTNDAAV